MGYILEINNLLCLNLIKIGRDLLEGGGGGGGLFIVSLKISNFETQLLSQPLPGWVLQTSHHSFPITSSLTDAKTDSAIIFIIMI